MNVGVFFKIDPIHISLRHFFQRVLVQKYLQNLIETLGAFHHGRVAALVNKIKLRLGNQAVKFIAHAGRRDGVVQTPTQKCWNVDFMEFFGNVVALRRFGHCHNAHALGDASHGGKNIVNQFFGGNTAVTGLMTGADLTRVLSQQPEGHRYLLPDVCLSRGVFLDGMRAEDLPRPVEVIKTDGLALRAALERTKRGIAA